MSDESTYVRTAAMMVAALLAFQRERMWEEELRLREIVGRHAKVSASQIKRLYYQSQWPAVVPVGLFKRLEDATRREINKAEAAGLTADNSPALRAAKAALRELEE